MLFWNRFLQPFFYVCIWGYCRPSSGRNTVSIVRFEYPVWVSLSRGCVIGLLVYLARPLTPTRTPKPPAPLQLPHPDYLLWLIPHPDCLFGSSHYPPPSAHIHASVLMCVCTSVCACLRAGEKLMRREKLDGL